MSTPCRETAWAEVPTFLGSSSYGCLARLLGPKLSRNDAQPVLLGALEREQGAAPVGYMNLENLMFSSWVRM